MSDLVRLWRTDDRIIFTEGDYGDDANGVTWTWTCYSDTLCSPHCEDDHCYLAHPEVCAVCGQGIADQWHYLCLDGGDSAHADCVAIHVSYPHYADTLYDCPACVMEDDETSYPAWMEAPYG